MPLTEGEALKDAVTDAVADAEIEAEGLTLLLADAVRLLLGETDAVCMHYSRRWSGEHRLFELHKTTKKDTRRQIIV